MQGTISCFDVMLPTVYFEKNKSDLNEIMKRELNDAYLILKNNSRIEAEIKGFADKGESKPDKLAQKRSLSVINYLVKLGLDKKRLSSKSFSDKQPVEDCINKTCDEIMHRRNRTCIFVLIKM